jgi:molybdenum cofactor guanylyltransferase
MGRDKALLPWGGSTLAEAVAREVAGAAGSATLVGKVGPGIGALDAIPDLYPGEGPLGGILTALDHTRSDWNLVVACDMPRVDSPFLRRLIDAANQSGACALLPRGPSGLSEPLCAVYHRRAREPLETRFASGERKITRALAGVEVAWLDVADVTVFQNLNTPEDWAAHAGE